MNLINSPLPSDKDAPIGHLVHHLLDARPGGGGHTRWLPGRTSAVVEEDQRRAQGQHEEQWTDGQPTGEREEATAIGQGKVANMADNSVLLREYSSWQKYSFPSVVQIKKLAPSLSLFVVYPAIIIHFVGRASGFRNKDDYYYRVYKCRHKVLDYYNGIYRTEEMKERERGRHCPWRQL